MLESLLSLLFASSFQLQEPALPEIETFDDSALLEISYMPELKGEWTEPSPINAGSVLAIDLESQAILYERNHTTKRPIASLTKLMTAHIILEENNLDEIVTVSSHAATTEGSSMNLQTGEEISVRHLLYGLMIESGNDAAIALAEYNAGSVSAFVDKMNLRAEALGMTNTRYSNPTGLDSSTAYSSAQDLAILSSYLLRDSTIYEIVKLRTAEITSQSGITHKLENTNVLLGELGIKGLKTGKTPAAGECLISLAEHDGHDVLTIVLGSESRFPDSQVLLQWIYKSYTW